MKVKNSISLKMPACAKNIALSRVTMASFASQLDFTLSEIEEIKVAVSEAVSNAVLHAYQNDSEDNYIYLKAVIYLDNLLEIVIKDKGKGIENIERAMEPSYTTDNERMGLGLTFIDSFMDELTVKSDPESGTELIMSKRMQSENNQSVEEKSS